MTRDETIALWQRCEDARTAVLAEGKPQEAACDTAKSIWNEWAEPLVGKRRILESRGLLTFKKYHSEEFITDWKLYNTEEGRLFHEESRCEFSGYEFKNYTDFGGFVFPGDAWFGRLPTYIVGSERSGSTFDTYCTFYRAIFFGDARFDRVLFRKPAGFQYAKFLGDVGFDHASFSNSALFSSAEFHKETWFGMVAFSNYTHFADTTFDDVVSFKGISEDRSFVMTGARFKTFVPDFSQAKFNEAPDFDQVDFPIPDFWQKHRSTDIAKYRAIRRLAVQGHDHDNEGKAFKGEIRSKRGTEHRWHDAAFWYGLAYDALSDFGRSMSRPLAIWFVSLLAFAVVYFWNAGMPFGDWVKPCVTDGAPKTLKAITLSAANAMPGIGSSRTEEARAFYECLSLAHAPRGALSSKSARRCGALCLFFFSCLPCETNLRSNSSRRSPTGGITFDRRGSQPLSTIGLTAEFFLAMRFWRTDG